MLAKMIDKIVSLKETKIFEIGGQPSPASRRTSTALTASASADSIASAS